MEPVAKEMGLGTIERDMAGFPGAGRCAESGSRGRRVKRAMVKGMAVDYGKLGKRVRERREGGRMSQAKLAKAVELSTQHISNIENARTKVSLEKLVDIANVLECSIDELVCDSLEKANIVFMNEAAGLFHNFSDAQVRAMPEFLKSCTCFLGLLERQQRQKHV